MTTRKTPSKADPPAPVPAPPEEEFLVDLDEEPIRPQVKYQGKKYDIKLPDDFGVADQHRLTRDGREFFKLWNSEKEPSKHEDARLDSLLNRMFDKVLDAPAAVRAGFSDGQKSRVVLAFTLAPLAQRTAQMVQTPEVQEARDGDPISGS